MATVTEAPDYTGATSKVRMRALLTYTITKKNRSQVNVSYKLELQAKSMDSSSHSAKMWCRAYLYTMENGDEKEWTTVADVYVNKGGSTAVTVSGTSWKTYYTAVSGTGVAIRLSENAYPQYDYRRDLNFQISGNDASSNGTYGGYFMGTSQELIPAMKSYAITYNANGGDGAPETGSKWDGESTTLSSVVPIMASYSFIEWNTSANGDGNSYSSGQTYTTDAALDLYAIWSKIIVASFVSLKRGTGTDDDTFTEDAISGTCIQVKYTVHGGTSSADRGGKVHLVETCSSVSSSGTNPGTTTASVTHSTTFASKDEADTPQTVTVYLTTAGLHSQIITLNVTDSTRNTVSISASVASASVPGFSMRKSDNSVIGVGIMAKAPDSGVLIDGDTVIEGQLNVTNSGGSTSVGTNGIISDTSIFAVNSTDFRIDSLKFNIIGNDSKSTCSFVTPPGTVLWNGLSSEGLYLTSNQKCSLKYPISSCMFGILTIWSYYNKDSKPSNYNWLYYPIPKFYISTIGPSTNYTGIVIPVVMGDGAANGRLWAVKYVYARDTYLFGNDRNSSGNAAYFMLRAVLAM